METGEKFGRLTALSFAFRDSRSNQHWECVCDCGTKKIIRGNNLVSGDTQSCGCLKTTHGKYGTPEYNIWINMKDRCYNPNYPGYKNYGGRGITVCWRWRDNFSAFYADMGFRPEGKTLDRKDNDGNYSKENCRWATQKEQNRNRRDNRIVEFNGKRQCMAAWAEEVGLKRQTLWYRLKNGWSMSRALTEKVNRG